jgi:hypothetical protein
VFDAHPSFRPVRRRDGYLALEDMGLIGDGTTAALVGLGGSIPWLCARPARRGGETRIRRDDADDDRRH